MKTNENLTKVSVAILCVGLFIVLFNTYQLASIYVTESDYTEISSVIPKGIPDIYGNELSISYDDVSSSNPQKADSTIQKLGYLDRSITLEGADLTRYIKILYTMENGMSCEYCCGARAIIFENGEPACGCAHSYAMRGLSKYLITQHGPEFTDEQIFEEVGKWKTLF